MSRSLSLADRSPYKVEGSPQNRCLLSPNLLSCNRKIAVTELIGGV
jgi:hypothetical protein